MDHMNEEAAQVDPEVRRRDERAAACRAELVLLGRDPEYELLILEIGKARLMSMLVHHALSRVDLTEQELQQVRDFEKVLDAKNWLMPVPHRQPRAPGVL